jgi:hypothetical protein
MRPLKLAAFLSLWAFFFGLVALVHLWISILRLPNRWKIVSRINRNVNLILRLILNIKVTVSGDEGQLGTGRLRDYRQPCELRRRHGARQHFPILFVSKREVKSWPIVGAWNVLCGTIFHRPAKERTGARAGSGDDSEAQAGSEHSAVSGGNIDQRRTNAAVSNRAAGGAAAQPVDHRAGDDRLQKHRRSAGRPTNRDRVYWYGDMDFLSHFWRLLGLRSVEVLVTIQPKIECFRYGTTRRGEKNWPRTATSGSSAELRKKTANGKNQKEGRAALKITARLAAF